MVRMVLLILLVLTGEAGAATYYASATGSGSTCSQAAPCTVVTGVGKLVAGDTLYIRGGTYSGSINVQFKAGTLANYITIAGYPGETATFYPATSNPVIIGGAGTAEHASYIAFRHLVFDGVNQACNTSVWGYQELDIKDGAHHWTLDDIEIKNNCSLGVLVGGGAAGVVIKNSRFHDLRGIDTPGYRSNGFYIHTTDGLLMENNDFYNNPGGGGQFYPGPNYNAIVRNNRIWNSGWFTTTNTGFTVYYTVTGSKFYNNLVYNNYKKGFYLFTTTGGEFYNNTSYGNAQEGFLIEPGSGTSGTIVKNNIAYNNAGGNLVNNAGGAVTLSNNLTSNPLFVNAAQANFHLQSGSPAIGAGVDLSSIFTTDYDGTTRTVPWDVGAYEYSSGGPPPDTTPPAAPTGLFVTKNVEDS